MTRDYTMEDFHAEMRRRGMHAKTNMQAREPSSSQERCTSCNGTEFVDAIDNDGQAYRGCTRCRIASPEDVLSRMAKITMSHGNSIVEAVPCGVHPLHAVKVRANGSRSGCPMCEMQIDDVCRSLTPSHDHAPRISRDGTHIVGCACGWRTPPGTTDSDTAISEHIAIARAAEGQQP